MDAAIHMVVEGLVQGVGFRWFVARHANMLGLRGYVENKYTGTVEVEAEGDRSLIEELVRQVRVGPRSAQVNESRARVEKSNPPIYSLPDTVEPFRIRCALDSGTMSIALSRGRKLILGGVDIPSPKGLEGHSDADVLLHAVADALLGAAALGDIGKHFPNTDQRYKGISSLILLKHVADLLAHHRYRIVNIDATVVLDAPKIAPHIDGMRQKYRRRAGICPSRGSP